MDSNGSKFAVAIITLIIIKEKEVWLLGHMYSLDSLSMCCVLWGEENRANYFSSSLPITQNYKINHPPNNTVKELRGSWHWLIFKTLNQRLRVCFLLAIRWHYWLDFTSLTPHIPLFSLNFFQPNLDNPVLTCRPPASKIISKWLSFLKESKFELRESELNPDLCFPSGIQEDTVVSAYVWGWDKPRGRCPQGTLSFRKTALPRLAVDLPALMNFPRK